MARRRLPLTAAITPEERWQLGYRPALDGLRGVAVLLVIAQHAGLGGFSRAGSAGVTLFFVLSGFLITTLLREEVERSGHVNLWAFYGRRVRRLLPALAVFLAAMAAAGVAWSVVAGAAFYYGNWLAVAGMNLMPISHTWSLSVEEQFYIVWPLTIIVFGLRRWILIMGIVAAVALRVAVWLATGDREWTFFASITRADALLAGCLLACGFARMPWQPGRLSSSLAVAALVPAIVIPDFGFLALLGLPLATIASVVLVARAAHGTRASKLSWRPLVAVGAISYGLYLWHGPILWVGRAYEVGPLVMLALVALSITVAALSRRYVEQPFLRRRSADHLRPEPLSSARAAAVDAGHLDHRLR